MAIAITLGSALPVRGGEPTRTPAGADASVVAGLVGRHGPVAVSGTLLDAHGRTTSGTIQAFAWPTEVVFAQLKIGDPIDRVPVAAGVAGPDGAFTLRLDRASLGRNHVSATGQV